MNISNQGFNSIIGQKYKWVVHSHHINRHNSLISLMVFNKRNKTTSWNMRTVDSVKSIPNNSKWRRQIQESCRLESDSAKWNQPKIKYSGNSNTSTKSWEIYQSMIRSWLRPNPKDNPLLITPAQLTIALILPLPDTVDIKKPPEMHKSWP